MRCANIIGIKTRPLRERLAIPVQLPGMCGNTCLDADRDPFNPQLQEGLITYPLQNYPNPWAGVTAYRDPAMLVCTLPAGR